MKMLFTVLIVTAFVFQSILSDAQEKQSKLDLVAGASISKGYLLGTRFHYQENLRIDLKLGTAFIPNKTYYTNLIRKCRIAANQKFIGKCR